MLGTTSPAVATSRPHPSATAVCFSELGARLARLLDTRAIPWALVLATFVVFSPSLSNGFVEWDDHVNLLSNLNYRGLGWPQIRWMFSSVLMGHYIPVTWLTFGLDYVLWGLNPFGYHLTNVVLHAVNVGLFYGVARRLLAKATTFTQGRLAMAASAAALFFALHPLRAESVAWATERRDVLSALFFLVTVLLYLKAADAEASSRRRLLAGSVAAYVLALLSKSIVMTLPAVLILLDVYPLRRIQGHWTARLLEKLPYAVLGLAGAITAYVAVALNSFFTPFSAYPWTDRVAMALYSLWFYVWKTALPVGLSPLYELPARVSLSEARFLVPAVLVLAISVSVLWLRRRWPAGLALWVYYGLVLGPVAGIVHSGWQLANDRYSYLSCLGWALLIGTGVGAVARAAATGALQPTVVRLAAAMSAVWFLGLAFLTWHQVQIWRDTESLWRYAVESDADCAICQDNLGAMLINMGHPAQAIPHLERSLAVRPNRAKTEGNLGTALLNLGRVEEGVAYIETALRHAPGDTESRMKLGLARFRQGRRAEAVEILEDVIEAKPKEALAHQNLAAILALSHRPAQAAVHYRRAIELSPDAPKLRFALTLTYLDLGRPDLAAQEYAVLLKQDRRLAADIGPAFVAAW